MTKLTKNELKQLITEDKNIENIDTSEITDMSFLFFGLKHFNQDISNWDVSNVTDMKCLFYGCEKFDCNISNWDVSNVKDMNRMFFNCFQFKTDLSSWNIKKLIKNESMFLNCNFEKQIFLNNLLHFRLIDKFEYKMLKKLDIQELLKKNNF